MKELAEAIKKETGDYSLIEDLMAQVVGERFGGMTREDVKAVMGKEGEGAEGGKHLKQEGGRLVIKSEPGVKTEKVVISVIVPSEEPALLPYCVKESEEQSDCETIGSDSDIEEINKTEVHNILKELARLRRKEAECFDRLAQVVPDMQDNEVVILAKKVRGSELPQCVYQMNQRIDNPRDFHAALAVGERLYSLYKYNQPAHPQPPYQTFVHFLMLVKLSCMSCYEVESTSTPQKKREKPRRSQCEESGRRGLKRHPQRRRARRPRLPPPLKTVH